ncbi:putative reverse transcriptase domain-containing protein [Tanacetum coccineum]
MPIELGDEALMIQGNRSDGYTSIVASEQRAEFFDRISTLERDNIRLRVQFLIHVVDSEDIHVDPTKIQSIKDWASPKTPTEICQILGLAGTIMMKKEKVIAYNSQKLKVHEKNYLTYDLELGEIVFSFKIWKHYLFDITLEKANVATDALSRKERAKPLRARALKAIRFNGTTRNTILEMGKYSHGFYHRPAKDNKLLLHDLGNRDRQKNYADVRHKPLEFQVGDKVMLKEYSSNETLVILLDENQIDDKLHFIKDPVEIMDCEAKRIRKSHIPIVKVRWNSRRCPEFIGDREDQFLRKYPHMFSKSVTTLNVTS